MIGGHASFGFGCSPEVSGALESKAIDGVRQMLAELQTYRNQAE